MSFYLSSTACVSLFIMLALNFVFAEAIPAQTRRAKFPTQSDLSGLTKRLAQLTFVYQANQTPADFIRTHPCVVGTWSYQKETERYWIGDVHYISDNTAADSIRYVAFRLKVQKSPLVKVNMKKWNGRILLQKANPQAGLDERAPMFLDFKVVGYSDNQQGGKRDGVIDLHKVMPYQPAAK